MAGYINVHYIRYYFTYIYYVYVYDYNYYSKTPERVMFLQELYKYRALVQFSSVFISIRYSGS